MYWPWNGGSGFSGAARVSSVVAAHAADDESDRQRSDRNRVGPLFDDLADNVAGFDRAVLRHASGISEGVLRLAVEILRRAFGLPHFAFHFVAEVASGAAKSFLHLAGEVLRCAGHSIVGHCYHSKRLRRCVNL
jgi:hypothetical protein